MLHGDRYHLLNKVFPETFGNQYNSITPFLTLMLDGTKEEWDTAFELASNMLESHPNRLQSLQNIHKDPSYYSKWYLVEMEGHFNFNGSVPAEQNHSSVAAHLGRGGNFEIAEHIKALVDRQVHFAKERKNHTDKLKSTIERFRSSLAGQRGRNEQEARKSLSLFGFNKYQNEARANLQMEVVDGVHHIWPAGVPAINRDQSRDYVQFSLADRCPCSFRKAWLLQCRHELTKDSFDASKNHHRWYNDTYYRTIVNQLDLFNYDDSSDFAPDNDGGSTGSSTVRGTDQGVAEALGQQEGSDDEDDDDAPLSTLVAASGNPKLGYATVMLACENLIRLVSRDPQELREVYDMIKSHTDRKRRGLSLIPSTIALGETQNASSHCMPGRLRAAPNARNMKRLRSRHEIHRGHTADRGRGASSSIATGNDGDHCRQNNKGKSCSFCRNVGHKIGKCPMITQWGNVPVRAEDRNSLAADMKTTTHFQLDPLIHSYAKMVARGGFPKSGVTGVILHNKFLVQDGASTTTCISCTILMGGGEPHKRYSEWPFPLDDVAAFILVSKRKIVINLMKPAHEPVGYYRPSQEQAGWHQFGAFQQQLVGLSQQSQQSTSLALMGYGITGPEEESLREAWA